VSHAGLGPQRNAEFTRFADIYEQNKDLTAKSPENLEFERKGFALAYLLVHKSNRTGKAQVKIH
jgi:hypothetical protein